MAGNWRLTSVSVKNLYGSISYTVNFANDQNLSVFIGENGFGKTTILRLIAMVTHPENSYSTTGLITQPIFDECKFVFSAGGEMNRTIHYFASRRKGKLRKVVDYEGNSLMECAYKEKKGESFPPIPSPLDSYFLEASRLVGGREQTFYSQLFSTLLSHSSLNPQSSENLEKQYHASAGAAPISNDFSHRIKNDQALVSKYLKMVKSRFHSDFYETFLDLFFALAIKDTTKTKRDIKKTINQAKKFGLLGDDAISLLQSFLLRFSDKAWKKLVKQIHGVPDNSIISMGFTGAGVFDDGKYRSLFNGDRRMWVRSFIRREANIEAFQDLLLLTSGFGYLKNLFEKVFPTTLIKYSLSFSANNGLYLHRRAGERLSLDILPSGQLNCVIIFYHLLMDSANLGLLLIDEPEISLHIHWQNLFLEEAMKIQKMNGGSPQIIVATHSPYILHNHNELLAKVLYE